jgi:sarcosine oxidase, subunit gamma
MVADVKLEHRGALDHLAEIFADASNDALQIRAEPCRTVVNLRGAAEDPSLVTDVQRVLGLELPFTPNRWHGDHRLAGIWLGPDEWLLIAPDEDAAQIEREMRAARPADPWLSMVDLSHHYTRLSLSGPGCRDLLARGCALDLHPNEFSTGDCAQTVLARCRVVLRAVETDVFELWVRNSFARYAAAWLLRSSAELRGKRLRQ